MVTLSGSVIGCQLDCSVAPSPRASDSPPVDLSHLKPRYSPLSGTPVGRFGFYIVLGFRPLP